MDYSFVVPVFNEEQTLTPLFEKVSNVMQGIEGEYEMIFIDDGSNDGSFHAMQKLSEKPAVKVVRLRRNFGKSCALEEGFRLSSGSIVFTMDADLQDDPDEIPCFIDKLKEGFDLVSGWKQDRKDSRLKKNLPSSVFNFVVGTFSGLRLHDYNCGFKAYKRNVIEQLSLYGDLHRYIPALVHSMGFNVTEIPVKHHARTFGKSKYGIERFFRGFYDFFTVMFLIRFLKRPMHFFGWVGSIFFFAGFIACSYLTVLWCLGETIGNRPLLTLGVLLILVGCQLICTGLVAEMITYGRQKKKTDSVVDRILS
ncbi:glycosyltransferase family 2 protein [Planctomycetota bacterium]